MLSGIAVESCADLAEELLIKHSGLGLHDLFAPRASARRLLATLLTGHWLELGPKLGYLASLAPDYRRNLSLACCKECVEEERARQQEPYWHTSHDFFGVVACSVHQTHLERIEGRAGYLALREAGEIERWGLRRIKGMPLAPVDVSYAKVARDLYALAGCGYIGEQLAQEYSTLIDDMRRSLDMPRRARSERARLVFDILSVGKEHAENCHLANAFTVLHKIYRDVVAGDMEFAVRMLRRERFEPAEQMSMHALGLVDVLGAAKRTSGMRRNGVVVTGCGFPRCRRYQPDLVERCDRLRGVRQLALSCECECGFTLIGAPGQRWMLITTFGRTAEAMLEELLRDGIRDDALLAHLLGVPPGAIGIMRQRSGRPGGNEDAARGNGTASPIEPLSAPARDGGTTLSDSC